MPVPGELPRPPLEKFWLRVDALAESALRTIPYVGVELGDFFSKVVVPNVGPKRDRAIGWIFRGLRSAEGGLQLALMRLLPLPSDPPQAPTRESR